jgi:hypothetical protein
MGSSSTLDLLEGNKTHPTVRTLKNRTHLAPIAVDNLNELPDVASKIGMELRNQYAPGYRPSNKTHDARWRKIKIKLRAPKGLSPFNVGHPPDGSRTVCVSSRNKELSLFTDVDSRDCSQTWRD